MPYACGARVGLPDSVREVVRSRCKTSEQTFHGMPILQAGHGEAMQKVMEVGVTLTPPSQRFLGYLLLDIIA